MKGFSGHNQQQPGRCAYGVIAIPTQTIAVCSLAHCPPHLAPLKSCAAKGFKHVEVCCSTYRNLQLVQNNNRIIHMLYLSCGIRCRMNDLKMHFLITIESTNILDWKFTLPCHFRFIEMHS
uniref:Uncharacterized protein n=1 Tax=Physcomitrium patens TaxID=3218 RepID=A0A7I4D8S0_PHYPA